MKIKSIKGKKCKRCKSSRAEGFIRGKAVCDKCFDILNKDNYKRMGLGINIPTNLKLLNL
jgi:hypothetical protein